MDIRKVKKLIELLDESGIAEIEITELLLCLFLSSLLPSFVSFLFTDLPSLVFLCFLFLFFP